MKKTIEELLSIEEPSTIVKDVFDEIRKEYPVLRQKDILRELGKSQLLGMVVGAEYKERKQN